MDESSKAFKPLFCESGFKSGIVIARLKSSSQTPSHCEEQTYTVLSQQSGTSHYLDCTHTLHHPLLSLFTLFHIIPLRNWHWPPMLWFDLVIHTQDIVKPYTLQHVHFGMNWSIWLLFLHCELGPCIRQQHDLWPQPCSAGNMYSYYHIGDTGSHNLIGWTEVLLCASLNPPCIISGDKS